MRLIDCLKDQGLSNRDIERALTHGKVFLGDVPTADASRDVLPEQVSIRPNAPRVIIGRDPCVVYCDASLAVVSKPSGVLSVAAAGRRRESNIVSMMARRFGAAHPVHRLDAGTSGLMLVALTYEAQARLKDALFHHTIERRYLALVRHHFPSEMQTFESDFVRNRGDGKRGTRQPHPDDVYDDEDNVPSGAPSKHAVTQVRLCQTLQRDASLIEARLHTGRTHQVRIHLAEAGFPILGDDLYGNAGIARSSRRLALHAWFLAFKHPITGDSHEFIAPLADDLESLRRRLQPALS